MSSFSEKKSHSLTGIDLLYCSYKKTKIALHEKVCNAIPNFESVDRKIQVAEFCKQSLLYFNEFSFYCIFAPISPKSIYCHCCMQYSDKKFECRLPRLPHQRLRSYEHHQEDLQSKLFHNDDTNIVSLLEQWMLSYLNLLFPLKPISCCFFATFSLLGVSQQGLLHLGHTFG